MCGAERLPFYSVRMLANGASGVTALSTGSTASTTPNPNGLILDDSNNLYISIQDTEVLPVVSTYQVLRQAPGGTGCGKTRRSRNSASFMAF